jgi:hypothetical protein
MQMESLLQECLTYSLPGYQAELHRTGAPFHEQVSSFHALETATLFFLIQHTKKNEDCIRQATVSILYSHALIKYWLKMSWFSCCKSCASVLVFPILTGFSHGYPKICVLSASQA